MDKQIGQYKMARSKENQLYDLLALDKWKATSRERTSLVDYQIPDNRKLARETEPDGQDVINCSTGDNGASEWHVVPNGDPERREDVNGRGWYVYVTAMYYIHGQEMRVIKWNYCPPSCFPKTADNRGQRMIYMQRLEF